MQQDIIQYSFPVSSMLLTAQTAMYCRDGRPMKQPIAPRYTSKLLSVSIQFMDTCIIAPKSTAQLGNKGAVSTKHTPQDRHLLLQAPADLVDCTRNILTEVLTGRQSPDPAGSRYRRRSGRSSAPSHGISACSSLFDCKVRILSATCRISASSVVRTATSPRADRSTPWVPIFNEAECWC